MSSPKRFANKRVLLTGGSHGIGEAIASRLAAEGAALVVVASAGDSDALDEVAARLASGGSTIVALSGDVGDPALADHAVALAGERLGGLDVLINNAGQAYYEEFLATPLEHLDRTYAVNLRAGFAFAQASARVMQPGSSIVLMASTASFMGEEFQAAFNATKGAVTALARSLAVDLAPLRIRCNAVAPGWVATRKTSAIIDDPIQWAKHRSRIPADRPAEPSEIAAVCAFLASDEASYVNGTTVVCDGGLLAGFRFSGWDARIPDDARSAEREDEWGSS